MDKSLDDLWDLEDKYTAMVGSPNVLAKFGEKLANQQVPAPQKVHDLLNVHFWDLI